MVWDIPGKFCVSILTHLNSGNDCVMKTKESGWGLAEARLHVWLHSTDTDVVWQLPPTLLPPETSQENLLTGMGWRMRIHPGCATSESANHDQHHATISTSGGGQAKGGQQAYNNDRCALSLLCLAVCLSSWKQLWQMQQTTLDHGIGACTQI